MISFIVPTIYASPEIFDTSIRSILDEAIQVGGEVVIVSSGENPADVKKDGQPKYIYKFIHWPIPLDYSAANNLGVKRSSGDILMLVNDDVILKPGTTQRMLDSMTEHKADILGIRLLQPNGLIQHGGVVFFRDQIAGNRYCFHPADFPAANVSEETAAVTFAAVMIKRPAWEALEGLDEGYKSMFEDVDFNLRAKEKGFKVWYDGTIDSTHHWSTSQGLNALLNGGSNMRRYLQKWIETHRADQVLERRKAAYPGWIYLNPGSNFDLERFKNGLEHPFYGAVHHIVIFGEWDFNEDLLKFCFGRFREVHFLSKGSDYINEVLSIDKGKAKTCIYVDIAGDEKYHDSLYETGSYQKAIASVEKIAAIDPIMVRISSTITPMEVQQLIHLGEIAGKYKTKIFLLMDLQSEWTRNSLEKYSDYLYLISQDMLVSMPFVYASFRYLKYGGHHRCSANLDAIVIKSDLQVSLCHEIRPYWTIENYPEAWGGDDRWLEVSEGWCFKKECFVNGPYALGIAKGQAIW